MYRPAPRISFCNGRPGIDQGHPGCPNGYRQQFNFDLHPSSAEAVLTLAFPDCDILMRVPRIIVSIAATILTGSLAWPASALRQIGMVNLPGSPGFSELAFAKGMLVMPKRVLPRWMSLIRESVVVIAQINGLQSPRGIAVDEQNGRVYVADAGGNAIAVISTDTWKVSDTIPVQGSPDQLLLADNGTQMLLERCRERHSFSSRPQHKAEHC